MRLFSDFTFFEKPPKPGVALIRWIAWRWLFGGLFFCVIVGIIAAAHYVGGQPIYYTNEDRYLSSDEARDVLALFLLGGGFFTAAGLAGVLLVPKT